MRLATCVVWSTFLTQWWIWIPTGKPTIRCATSWTCYTWACNTNEGMSQRIRVSSRGGGGEEKGRWNHTAGWNNNMRLSCCWTDGVSVCMHACCSSKWTLTPRHSGLGSKLRPSIWRGRTKRRRKRKRTKTVSACIHLSELSKCNFV